MIRSKGSIGTITLVILMTTALCLTSPAYAEVVIFQDGSQMEVESYELKGKLLVLTTREGRVRSVPLSLVDLEKMRQRSAGTDPPTSSISRASAQKQPPRRAREAKIRELLESSGINILLHQTPNLLTAAMTQAERLTPGTRMEAHEKLRNALDKSCQPKQVYDALLQDFAKRTDDSRLNNALAWIHSPLSLRMIELEQSAWTPDGLRLLMEYANGLNVMPTANRLEKLRRLDEARGMTEARIELQLQLLTAIMDGPIELAHSDQQISEEEKKEALKRARAQIRASTQNASLVSLLFTYQSVSDTELAEYLAHWESDEGRWLSRSLQDSLYAGMGERFQTAVQSLGQPTTGLPPTPGRRSAR